jgi:N4-gp56 family major capsid protein
MAGYNPASNLTSNLPQTQAKYYDKNFFDNLKFETPYLRVAERRQLPLNAGNTIVFFEYPVFGPNTSQSAEGTVGTGLTITPLTNQAVIGEFSDYASFSTLATFTGIDPMVTNVSKELAYRLGQSLSLLTRTAEEAWLTIDTSTGVQLPANTPMSITNVRAAVQSMAGRAVLPFHQAEAKFGGVIHPFVVGDIANDPSNNSIVDIWKRTVTGLDRLESLPGVDLQETIEFAGTGIRFHQTSLVTQTANYKGSGNTALRTYINGKDGVIAIDLNGGGDTGFADGNYRTIRPLVRQNVEPSVADMAGVISGWTSYRIHFTTSLVPDTTGRVRMIDSVSTIS